MPKIKKNKNRGAAISTASLPDIIFMLLFFFMVTTVMRETELQVEVEQPTATEVVKLENRALVDYIYVGTPIDKTKGSVPRIQLNGQLATVEQIQAWKQLQIKERGANKQDLVITALKVDKDAEMGLVSDIKLELRAANALKICYSTAEALVAEL